MRHYIYFENNGQRKDYCVGSAYYNFLDYAFEETDFFMLVYVNYYGKGYSKIMREFKKALKPYKIKSRTNPSWPGTLATYCWNTTYKIIFYKNDVKARDILKKVDRLSAWSCPSYPQDLAFFKGNQCWSFSVGHEKIAGIIDPTDKDLDFLEENGLALRTDVEIERSDYFDAYNEHIIDNK